MYWLLFERTHGRNNVPKVLENQQKMIRLLIQHRLNIWWA